MVTRILSLTGSGVKDFLVQRVSAIILLLYVFFLLGIFCFNPPMNFLSWRLLFDLLSVKLFTLLALLSLIAHAWVGIWTVLTDYVHNAVVRGFVQILIVLAFIACIFWGIWILWS